MHAAVHRNVLTVGIALFLPTVAASGVSAAATRTAVPEREVEAASANGPARLIPSPEPGWPQWRGPRRDGICDETGLLPEWPADGPKLLWKAGELGRGYSAPIVTHGRIYLTGDVGDELHIFALDPEGRVVWRAKNGEAWRSPYPGARAICTYSEGRLYHENAHGRVACFDAITGAELWAVDLFDRFGGKNLTWAMSECLVVDGPRVIVTPGGTQALMAALDKQTGATLWTTEPLRLGQSDPPAHIRVTEPAGETDSANYGSPILFELGGRRQLVNCSLRHIFGVDADNGRLLWSRPIRTKYSVIAATPVLVGNAVFVTAPDTDDGGLYRLRIADGSVQPEKVWSTKLDTCHGGSVFVDGALYGSWYRRDKGWACLDAKTGEVRYQTSDLAMGSVLYADARLYCLSQEGEVALIRPAADGFEFKGRFRLVPDRINDAWTHPVICDRRLYLRYHENLFCFDVRKP